MSTVPLLVELIGGPKTVVELNPALPVGDIAAAAAKAVERSLVDDAGAPKPWKLYAPTKSGGFAPAAVDATLADAAASMTTLRASGEDGGFAGPGEHEGAAYLFRVRLFVPGRPPPKPVETTPDIADEEAIDLTDMDAEEHLETVRRIEALKNEELKKRKRRRKRAVDADGNPIRRQRSTGEMKRVREGGAGATGEMKRARRSGEMKRPRTNTGEMKRARSTGEMKRVRDTGEMKRVRDTGEMKRVRATGERKRLRPKTEAAPPQARTGGQPAPARPAAPAAKPAPPARSTPPAQTAPPAQAAPPPRPAPPAKPAPPAPSSRPPAAAPPSPSAPATAGHRPAAGNGAAAPAQPGGPATGERLPSSGAIPIMAGTPEERAAMMSAETFVAVRAPADVIAAARLMPNKPKAPAPAAAAGARPETPAAPASSAAAGTAAPRSMVPPRPAPPRPAPPRPAAPGPAPPREAAPPPAVRAAPDESEEEAELRRQMEAQVAAINAQMQANRPAEDTVGERSTFTAPPYEPGPSDADVDVVVDVEDTPDETPVASEPSASGTPVGEESIEGPRPTMSDDERLAPTDQVPALSKPGASPAPGRRAGGSAPVAATRRVQAIEDPSLAAPASSGGSAPSASLSPASSAAPASPAAEKAAPGTPSAPSLPTPSAEKAGELAEQAEGASPAGSAKKKSGGAVGLVAAVLVLAAAAAGAYWFFVVRPAAEPASGGDSPEPQADVVDSAEPPATNPLDSLAIQPYVDDDGNPSTVAAALASYNALGILSAADVTGDALAQSREIEVQLSALCRDQAGFDTCDAWSRVAYTVYAGCEQGGCATGEAASFLQRSKEGEQAALSFVRSLPSASMQSDAVKRIALHVVRLGAADMAQLNSAHPQLAELARRSCSTPAMGLTTQCKVVMADNEVQPDEAPAAP